MEGGNEGAEHRDLQVGFGKEARIGLVKVQKLVDEIRRRGPAVSPLAGVAFDHRAVKLVHPGGGAPEPRGPVQERNGGDVRQEEHTDEVGQRLVPGAR